MAATAQPVEMKKSLTLTGITVNAMALIAPGAFLWTTFQVQAALTQPHSTVSTASAMWPGLLFALVLALLTAYSYSELARIYPDAGTGSSYYFAEAALMDKEGAHHRKWARPAKLAVGWISHLYYWIYPGIMVAFTGTLFGYIYTSLTNGKVLNNWELSGVCIVFALVSGYIAFRGISGSTMTAIVINVIQITTLVLLTILFIVFRIGHPHAGYEAANAAAVIIPKNFMNVLYQSTIAILLLVGFESVTALGAEAINPQKDIRRGILLSLIIQGGVCYLFEYFGANFVIGKTTAVIANPSGPGTLHGYTAAGIDPAPIGTMSTRVANIMWSGSGKTISLIIAATVLIALIGTTLACLNTGVRVTYAMARDGEMPSILSLLHGEFATPHGGIWVLTIISAVIGMYGVRNVDNLTQITIASNVGTFLVYGFTCLIAIVAFASHHDKHIGKHYVVPGIGALMNVAMLFAVIYLGMVGSAAVKHDYLKAVAADVVWIIIGVVWVLANPKMRGSKLIDSNVPKRESTPAPV
ncbi:MAG TPA: APC family permease [Acidimicrobiales bacterium]|nr:APC family permease [Acidimicrobiales bacterium]